MSTPIPHLRLYDAWLFKSEEWTRRPLGLHPDAESALAEAKENHPDVVSVELAGEGCPPNECYGLCYPASTCRGEDE